MSQQLPCSRSSNHVLTWSISIGLLFAAISGIGIQSSGEHYQGETWAKFRPVFAPETAFIGSLVGAAFGALVRLLWGLPAFGRMIAGALVTLTGGIVGLMAAALLGAETTIIVSVNSVQGHHGTSPAVLGGGLILGLILGALSARRLLF